MADSLTSNKAVNAGIALILGVVMLSVAVGISDSTNYETLVSVDTEDEWTDDSTSDTGVNYDDGYLQLDDSETSGDHTGTKYAEADTEYVNVEAYDLDDGSVDVTVTGYDDSDSETDTEDVTLSEEGEERIDVSDFSSDTEEYEVQYDLSRDSTDDTTPRVDAYSLEEGVDGITDWVEYLFAIFALLLVAYLGKRFV